MTPRPAGTLPTFFIDTAFHTVDADAGTEWVASVKTESESLGTHVTDALLEAAPDVLPFGDGMTIAAGVLESVGIDLLKDSQEQPLEMDLTELFNRLKANILDIVDQDDFEAKLNELSSAYKAYTQQLQMVQKEKDYQNILTKLSPVLENMNERFIIDIQVQHYVDHYAFFMLEPLVSHASLHYTAALLRTAAQTSLYHQSPKDHPDLMHDVCVDIEAFQNKINDYMTWFEKYWTQAESDRVAAVPTQASCSGSCDISTSFPASNEHLSITYSWKDNWPLLAATAPHQEGWSASMIVSAYSNTCTVSGANTDGTALNAEISAYITDMKAKLAAYGSSMQAALQTMLDQVKQMVDTCKYTTAAAPSTTLV